MLLLLIYPLSQTVQAAQDDLAGSKPANRYAVASLWMVQNIPAEERIFQTDWDDFTRLFFYDTTHTYTAGLDPTYLELQDPDLYETWVDITKGRVDNPSTVIQNQFGASYVFSDLNHNDFIAEAQDDPNMIEVFRTEDAIIFQIQE